MSIGTVPPVDPYEVLGVAREAGPADVRRAYLRLARLHHPDGHAAAGPAAVSRAEHEMQQINAAWAILGDPIRRQRFDEGQDPDAPPPPGVTVRPATGKGWTPRADDTAWMDDFEAWKYEDRDFVPPDVPRSAPRQMLTILPVAVFGLAIVAGSVGMVMQVRPLIAVAIVGVLASCLLFVGITLLELRGRASR